GGGVALVRAVDALADLKGSNEDQDTGINIIRQAIESPLRTIVLNAGGEPSVVINKIRENKGNYGYNARTDQYEDLFAAGVIDPTKVTRLALENAASIAALLLTTECVVADVKEDGPAMPPMGGG
ncbi:MAG TPA: molecular chaperone GroEL, partial [Algoriphagus sp.]|nr:molecular chaperone GroEL [Algoriphagus sp.]